MDDQNKNVRCQPKRRPALSRRLQGIDREIILTNTTFQKLAIGWTAVILLATLSPSDGESLFEVPIPHFDKVVHFGLFFVHAILVGAAQKVSSRFFTGLIVGVLLALFTEWMQLFVPGRQTDIYDGLADICGTISGMLALYVLNRYKESN